MVHDNAAAVAEVRERDGPADARRTPRHYRVEAREKVELERPTGAGSRCYPASGRRVPFPVGLRLRPSIHGGREGALIGQVSPIRNRVGSGRWGSGYAAVGPRLLWRPEDYRTLRHPVVPVSVEQPLVLWVDIILDLELLRNKKCLGRIEVFVTPNHVHHGTRSVKVGYLPNRLLRHWR